MRGSPRGGAGFDFEHVWSESSEWKDGALLIQPGALGAGGANAGAPSMQPLGLYARPADPTSEGAAGLLVGRQGDTTFGMPTTDPRGIDTVPQGPKGSVTLYAPQPTLTSYLHLDGGSEEGKAFTQLLLKYGSKSLSLTFDTTTEGQENIQIRSGDGCGITLTGDKKLFMNSSNGQVSIELNDTEIVLNGNVRVNGGLMLGGPSGVPVPTSTELTNLVTALSVIFAAGFTVDLGTMTAKLPGFTFPTPGSSKVSVAP